MIKKALRYGLVFTLVEFIVHLLAYFLEPMLLRSSDMTSALFVSGVQILWRLIYLQAVLQVVFLAGLWIAGRQRSLVLTLFSGLLALLVSAIVYFHGHVDMALSLFGATTRSVGEGLMLTLTLTITWLVIPRIAPSLTKTVAEG